eukprot:3324825-Prymnesium_polylepis.1
MTRIVSPCDTIDHQQGDPICPTEDIPTVGLIWAPPDCSERTMTNEQLAPLSLLHRELKIMMLGDSTVRYLHHHLMTVLDGSTYFSYKSPSNNAFHPSRRFPRLSISYMEIGVGTTCAFPAQLAAVSKGKQRTVLRWLNEYFEKIFIHIEQSLANI